jgi:DNA repair exonuclease SbcCD nuclease subunit
MRWLSRLESMLRFIHTSDLHLGKRFGRMPEELRGRLIEARHGIIERLAALARSHDATAILVAGDVFDTETPSPAALRQALQAMAADPGITWVLIPGNHDSLAADELWTQMEQRRPENVVLALSPQPVALAPGAVVLPAPCSTRRPGRDLTAWMSSVETAEDTIRVGLAHGAVQAFGEDGASDVIPPDRAETARLDYLALGDWHGQIRITDRTWYSGAPEPDRFKHNTPGGALVVTIEGPGAKPEVEAIEIGSFQWETLTLRLMAGEDAAAQLEGALPVASRRRQTLLRIVAEGRAQLSEQAALQAAAKETAPDFALMEFRDDALRLDYEVADLDAIDQGGALRDAAEMLLAETQADDLSPEDRAAARAALSRLYSYVTDMS